LFTKTTGFWIVPLWLTSMAWLIAHDVLPTLTAGDPPRVTPSDWRAPGVRETQFAVYLDHDRIGTIWSKYRVDETSVQRNDVVWIEQSPVPYIAPLRVTVDTVFTPDGWLDELTVLLENSATRKFKLHGERFHADFSFTFEMGSHDQAFKVPLSDGSLLTGGFNPFSRLAGIEVGQRWRVQVFNPIAALTGLGPRFLSILVSVTRKETIAAPEGNRECLVVEAPNAKAWVDEQGDVVMQEMTLPVSGTMRFVREAEYDRQGESWARNYSFRQ